MGLLLAWSDRIIQSSHVTVIGLAVCAVRAAGCCSCWCQRQARPCCTARQLSAASRPGALPALHLCEVLGNSRRAPGMPAWYCLAHSRIASHQNT